MRVSLDERLFRDSITPHFASEDYYFKRSNLKLFGDVLYKKAQNKTEFVLQTFATNRGSRVVNHSLRIYEDAATFLAERGGKLKIETPIADPNVLGSHIFVGKLQGKPGELLVKSIPFDRYEEEEFKRGLYEVAMLQRILKEENNRFGYVFHEAFVV